MAVGEKAILTDGVSRRKTCRMTSAVALFSLTRTETGQFCRRHETECSYHMFGYECLGPRTRWRTTIEGITYVTHPATLCFYLFYNVRHFRDVAWLLRRLCTPNIQEETIATRPADCSARQASLDDMQPRRCGVVPLPPRNRNHPSIIPLADPFPACRATDKRHTFATCRYHCEVGKQSIQHGNQSGPRH